MAARQDTPMHPARSKGFTLLELMVAVSMGVAVMSVIVAIFRQSIGANVDLNKKIAVLQGGRNIKAFLDEHLLTLWQVTPEYLNMIYLDQGQNVADTLSPNAFFWGVDGADSAGAGDSQKDRLLLTYLGQQYNTELLVYDPETAGYQADETMSRLSLDFSSMDAPTTSGTQNGVGTVRYDAQSGYLVASGDILPEALAKARPGDSWEEMSSSNGTARFAKNIRLATGVRVTVLDFYYLDDGGTWRTQWNQEPGGTPGQFGLPEAVAYHLEVTHEEDMGKPDPVTATFIGYLKVRNRPQTNYVAQGMPGAGPWNNTSWNPYKSADNLPLYVSQAGWGPGDGPSDINNNGDPKMDTGGGRWFGGKIGNH